MSDDTPTYRVVRFFKDSGERETIETGLTKAEAKAHCSSKESSSDKCTTREAIKLTANKGPWFDGFEEE